MMPRLPKKSLHDFSFSGIDPARTHGHVVLIDQEQQIACALFTSRVLQMMKKFMHILDCCLCDVGVLQLADSQWK